VCGWAANSAPPGPRAPQLRMRMHTSKPNGAEKQSEVAPPSSPKEILRRTRGSDSRLRSESQAANTKATSHANGSANHAAEADAGARASSRANGHGHAFSSDHSLQAGSDDANGASVAIAASTEAAGADRDACAALAGQRERPNQKKRHPSRALKGGEERPRVPSEASAESCSAKRKEPPPPGEG